MTFFAVRITKHSGLDGDYRMLLREVLFMLYYPDTEVIVTDSTGKTVTWYPIYGITALPYDSENERRLAYDFTFTHRRGTTASAATSAGRVPPAPS